MQIGDYIDDYCSRCKRTSDHSVTALAGDAPVKVSCRTCSNEHKYRGNKGKKEMTASQAFDRVLASMNAQLSGISSPAKPKRKK
jgi:hypothetical protein